MADKLRSFIENKDASGLGLTAAHISANPSMYEAARSSFFTLTIDGLENLSRAAYGGKDEVIAGEGYTAQSSLTLSVTEAAVPHFSLGQLEYRRGNEVVKFAGLPTFDENEIKLDDILGLETKNILMAWQGLAYNIETRKGGRMADYKKEAVLCEYTQDYELIRSWTLYGCWISKISEDNFNKASGNDDKRTLSVTLQYDRAEMTYGEE